MSEDISVAVEIFKSLELRIGPDAQVPFRDEEKKNTKPVDIVRTHEHHMLRSSLAAPTPFRDEEKNGKR